MNNAHHVYDNAVIKPLRLKESDETAQVDAFWRSLRHSEFSLRKAAGNAVVKPEARQRLLALADSVNDVLRDAGLGGMGL